MSAPWWHADDCRCALCRPSALDYFFDKVDVGDCWLWTGAIDRGYGKFWTGGKTRRAHRWLFEELVGPVPEGFDLDHLCRVRACVNPDHLQPVTRRVNLQRGIGSNQRRSRSRQSMGDGEALIAADCGMPEKEAA